MSGADALALKYDATAPAVTGGQAARGRTPAVGTTARCRSRSRARTRRRAWTRARTSHTAAGQRDGDGPGHVQRQGRQRQSAQPVRLQVRRDGTRRDRRAARATAGSRRLVREPCAASRSPPRTPPPASTSASPVDYAGPDGADAVLVGRCRDRAGNGGTRNFTLDYDATPPALSLSAESGDGSVALSWQTSPDATSVEVSRTPGVDGAPSSIVFSGPGTSFVDGRVATARATPTRSASRTPPPTPARRPSSGSPPLRRQVRRARRTSPASSACRAQAPRRASARRSRLRRGASSGRTPRRCWCGRRCERARYYNVQLFRGERKLLSVWPTRPRYQLKRSWRFRGKSRRLVPGSYRWMVWPGYGRRAKGRYGKPIVRSTFSIEKAAAAEATAGGLTEIPR